MLKILLEAGRGKRAGKRANPPAKAAAPGARGVHGVCMQHVCVCVQGVCMHFAQACVQGLCTKLCVHPHVCARDYMKLGVHASVRACACARGFL